eukprot:scaffold1596_cov302-Pinguiococcus_pyrenoidosus.AAC.63
MLLKVSHANETQLTCCRWSDGAAPLATGMLKRPTAFRLGNTRCSLGSFAPVRPRRRGTPHTPGSYAHTRTRAVGGEVRGVGNERSVDRGKQKADTKSKGKKIATKWLADKQPSTTRSRQQQAAAGRQQPSQHASSYASVRLLRSFRTCVIEPRKTSKAELSAIRRTTDAPTARSLAS